MPTRKKIYLVTVRCDYCYDIHANNDLVGVFTSYQRAFEAVKEHYGEIDTDAKTAFTCFRERDFVQIRRHKSLWSPEELEKDEADEWIVISEHPTNDFTQLIG